MGKNKEVFKIVETYSVNLQTNSSVIYTTIGFKDNIGFDFKVGVLPIKGEQGHYTIVLTDFLIIICRKESRTSLLKDGFSLYGKEVFTSILKNSYFLYIPLTFLTKTEISLIKSKSQFKLNLLLDNIFKRLIKLKYHAI